MPSSISENTEMLREIIMDHYSRPRNFRETDDPKYLTVHMDSSSCIDDIYLQILFEDGKVKDVCWHGKGCAISTASTSIMTTLLKGKTVKEANYIMEQFNRMLNEQDFDESAVGEAIAFVNTYRQPSRITCANISWRGFEKLVAEEEEEEKQHGKGK
jgi:nitrogen fixation NifU-like protein